MTLIVYLEISVMTIYFLAVVYKVVGHNLGALRSVQAVIGAGSCALVGLAGYRFFSVRVGVIAGGALALYAPALFFDALIQKSVLDLFFLALSLWLQSSLARPGAQGVLAVLDDAGRLLDEFSLDSTPRKRLPACAA